MNYFPVFKGGVVETLSGNRLVDDLSLRSELKTCLIKQESPDNCSMEYDIISDLWFNRVQESFLLSTKIDSIIISYDTQVYSNNKPVSAISLTTGDNIDMFFGGVIEHIPISDITRNGRVGSYCMHTVHRPITVVNGFIVRLRG